MTETVQPASVMEVEEGQLTRPELVREIMHKPVIVVYPDSTLADAYRQMAQKGIRRLPVVENEGSSKIVGIISDRHIRLAADSPFLEHTPKEVIENLSKHKVAEAMKVAVVTIEADAPIVDAAKEMRVSNVGGLPVVDAKGDLVGMITRTDLLDHLIRLLEPIAVPSPNSYVG